MKKKIFIMVAIFAITILAPNLCLAIGITNNASKMIIVNVGGKRTMISVSKSTTVDVAPANGEVAVNLSILEGGTIKNIGYYSLPVVNGNCVVTDAVLKQPGAKSLEELKPSSSPPPLSTPRIESDRPNIVGVASQRMQVVDSSSHRLVILSEPFQGVALKPNQTSVNYYEVVPGLKQLSALIDMDNDANSTGRNYMQAVISKIIVEGETLLVIKDENILINSGEKVKIRLFSHLNFKALVVGSDFAGAALSPNRYWKGRVTVHYGFVSLAIQYYQDGLKYQANIELIITPQDKVIHIYPADVKNARIIESSGDYKVKK